MTVCLTTRIGRALGRVRTCDIRGGRIVAVVLLAAGLVAAAPRPALAVSMRDLVELSRAGLSDDVLVALIEADGTVFNLDGPKILDLRASGLSERVIMAMIRTSRQPAAPEPAAHAAPAPAAPTEPVGAPYFVVIGQDPPAPTPPPTPTYIVPWVPWTAWPRPVGPSRPFMDRRGFGRFINDGWVEPSRRP